MTPANHPLPLAETPAAARSPLEVRVARSIAEVWRMARDWRSLEATPATDLDAFLTAFESGERPDHRPHALLVYEGGAPRALAAGRCLRRPVTAKLGYRRLHGPRARVIELEPGTLVGDLSGEASRAIANELWRSLVRGEAELAVAREIRSDDPLAALFATLPRRGCRDRVPDRNVRWRLDFPESADAPLPLSGHTRRHLRYYEKRLRRAYGERIRIESFTAAGDLDRLARACESIACTTYQRGIGVGFRDDEATRRRIRFEMERGWFRSWLLSLDDRPVAFWMGLRYGDTYHSGDTGFDPVFRADRPGELLLGHLLEALRREPGLRRLDFGFGDAEYKQRYSTESFEEATVAMFAPSLRGVLLNAGRLLANGSNQTLKSAAQRLEVLDWIRARMRRRAAASAGRDTPQEVR